ncbi:MAG: 2-amino-4-hydroxy-6-hydroxymethyldihydropteridine diphosphokinase [Flammeovirgaceae bacterium]|nr:2-amino-4-hydroxy-6-hydroxymethyldihydropteridine diphosphokinase [Flammeovirgaceae bacterium]
MELNRTFLLLGSNLGDRVNNLEKAIALIGLHIGVVLKRSSFMKLNPWGKSDQPDFLNMALIIKSSLGPEQILSYALSIEHKMGRSRVEKWGARLIDIDLLYVETEIINSAELTLPHPGIAHRRFVLEPLTEIAPNFIHPVLNKNHIKLLEVYRQTGVRKL